MDMEKKLDSLLFIIILAVALFSTTLVSGAQERDAFNASAGASKSDQLPDQQHPALNKKMPQAGGVAPNSAESQNKASAGKSANADAKNPSRTDWQPIQPKSFSAAQKAKECAKYEGKMISYYEDIYHVEKCKRRLVINTDLTHQITRKYNVLQVNNDTIIMLPEGKPLDTLNSKYALASRSELCHMLADSYITTVGDDIYLVDNCKRRIFPDWETFEAHKKKTGKEEITELTEIEVDKIPEGKEMPSVMPDVFKKLLKGSHEADVIPIDEACRGVNGKYVSYYSRIYFIEKCRKREIDPEDFLTRHKSEKVKLQELSSEQWLSLPDGKALGGKDREQINR